VDSDFIMENSKIGARTALAKLFIEKETLKGQWYNLRKPDVSDEINAEINAIFPQLSSILNLDESTMEKILNHCGLCKEYGSNITPNEQNFRHFIAEYSLDIEYTVFMIGNRRQYWLKIGYLLDPRTPKEYWKCRNQDAFVPPNIRIYRLSREFAASVGRMGLRKDDVSDEDGFDDADDGQAQLDNDSSSDLNDSGVDTLNGMCFIH